LSLLKNASRQFGLGLLLAGGLLLSGCQGGIDGVFPKAEVPIPAQLVQKMKAKGMKPSSPILLRIYKTENVLEVWKKKDTGRYDLLETYEICKWSGKLGPKFKEGDRQAPEGFYKVGKAQLNPNSKYHLSFNIGYPNTFDRAHGRTGTHLMVHGACSSAGCYSMTDELVEEIYALAREAIRGGQDYFQVQAYPFRMTAKNLAKHAAHPQFEFWKMLKEGSDHFELTNYPPKVDVCEKRYLFNRVPDEGETFSSRAECPPVTMPASLLTAWQARIDEEKLEFKKALKRHKLIGTFSDTALAGVDVETISLMAKGSEVLPPPTPQIIQEPEEPAQPPSGSQSGEPAIASAAPVDGTKPVTATDNTSLPGLTSAARNEAILAGRTPAPSASPSAISDTAPVEGNNATVRTIPVPQQAPRSNGQPVSSVQSVTQANVQPSKPQAAPKPRQQPWWIRKTKQDDAPTSLIAPDS